jgi:hypothetical protein
LSQAIPKSSVRRSRERPSAEPATGLPDVRGVEGWTRCPACAKLGVGSLREVAALTAPFLDLLPGLPGVIDG